MRFQPQCSQHFLDEKDHKDVGALLEETLLNPQVSISFTSRGCAVLWVVWGESNNRVFKGVEGDPCEIWSLVLLFLCGFRIQRLFVTILELFFCIVGIPFYRRFSSFLWVGFCYPCILPLLLNESGFSYIIFYFFKKNFLGVWYQILKLG